MSVIIKSTEMNYKDPVTGNYKGVNTIAEKKSDEFLVEISRIGQEVISSIPADYTDLNAQSRYNIASLITNYTGANKNSNGLVATWDASRRGYHIVGTATANSWFNIFSQDCTDSKFHEHPVEFNCEMSGTYPSGTNIAFRLFPYINDVLQSGLYYYASTTVFIQSNWNKILCRVDIASGTTVDMFVSADILNASSYTRESRPVYTSVLRYSDFPNQTIDANELVYNGCYYLSSGNSSNVLNHSPAGYDAATDGYLKVSTFLINSNKQLCKQELGYANIPGISWSRIINISNNTIVNDWKLQTIYDGSLHLDPNNLLLNGFKYETIIKYDQVYTEYDPLKSKYHIHGDVPVSESNLFTNICPGSWDATPYRGKTIYVEWQYEGVIGTDTVVQIYYKNTSDSLVYEKTLTISENQAEFVLPNDAISIFARIRYSGNQTLDGYFSVYCGLIRSLQNRSGGSEEIINNYYNTYEVECSPQITTDTNNYLASTNDNTDRTFDIISVLNATGACHLGPGIFVISNLTMPENSLIDGCGKSTQLYLNSTVTNGFAIKLNSCCQVKSLCLCGNESSHTPTSEVGTRNGIIFEGTADDPVSPATYQRSIIDNVYIQDFDGSGILLSNTGVNYASNLCICNVFIYRCDAGLNIAYSSEFSRITNVCSQRNWYGCIDNGGNNNFANCDFSGNKIGLLIDNSMDQSPNNSHGSFVGCTFNHSDSGNGVAIKILGAGSGEIFTGAQIFYGAIEIDNSKGIRFIGANIGRTTPITITDSTVITFSDCTFRSLSESPLTQSGNTRLEFKDCYILTTGEVYDPMSE